MHADISEKGKEQIKVKLDLSRYSVDTQTSVDTVYFEVTLEFLTPPPFEQLAVILYDLLVKLPFFRSLSVTEVGKGDCQTSLGRQFF